MNLIGRHKRRWRAYKTELGRCPVEDFLDELPEEDFIEVAAAMKEVQLDGLLAARHVRGDIYEVRAEGKDVIYRILFATEGRRRQVLLSLEAFEKKTRETPQAKIEVAQQRLNDWRTRGADRERKRRLDT
ncbi:MAG TPA: type II toxin-antitoxin system RelE/ParE family toxin [Chloroflexota bacterium]|nr:type II toxin-antitoxin system RelE/ParE family toxin [Chloroflexota bacterium]